MNHNGGLIVTFRDYSRKELLLDYISQNKTFTDTFSAYGTEIKKINLAILSFEKSILSYAALVHRGNRVATAKDCVRFNNFVDLEGITLKDLAKSIKKQEYDRLKESIKCETSRLPKMTWKHIWGEIKKLRPDIAVDLERLEKLCTSDQKCYYQKGYDIVALEKDATGLCLDIFGEDRKQLSSLWTPDDSEKPASFLSCLKKAQLKEDTMIQHDTNIFDDWIIDNKYQVGAIEFSKDNRKLTIINANRTSIEHTLGVDLVYYNHKYKAFVMVQYKRMDSRKGEDEIKEAVYRPVDSSYKEELQRMKKYLEYMPQYTSDTIYDFRLTHNPFFFKLCPKVIFEPLSNELIKGMYIPFDYWDILVKSPKTKGSRGGTQITYKNTDRHFNNTSFIYLVKDGWIGSPVNAEPQLSKLLQDCIEGNKSVIYAVETDNNGS